MAGFKDLTRSVTGLFHPRSALRRAEMPDAELQHGPLVTRDGRTVDVDAALQKLEDGLDLPSVGQVSRELRAEQAADIRAGKLPARADLPPGQRLAASSDAGKADVFIALDPNDPSRVVIQRPTLSPGPAGERYSVDRAKLRDVAVIARAGGAPDFKLGDGELELAHAQRPGSRFGTTELVRLEDDHGRLFDLEAKPLAKMMEQLDKKHPLDEA